MDNQMIESIQMLQILDKRYSNKYQKMSRNDLIKEIVFRDNAIEELKENIRLKNEMDEQKIEIYKNKLGQQIEQNQKVVSSFAQITEVIADIINKLTPEQNGSVSRSTIMSKIRQSMNAQQQQKSIEEQLNDSSFSCFDEIISDTFKLLQYLRKLINQLKDNRSESGQIKIMENLRQQNVKLREQNRLLERLLKKTQLQKNQITKTIFQSSKMKDISIQIESMGELELRQLIKKQQFKITQLKKEKKNMLSGIQKQREGNFRKYQQLLFQVKCIRDKKSLVSSMGCI